jgi:hypothetical protein
MNIIKYKASEFATQNLILQNGQFGLEIDTRKLKLGNGSTPWNSLSYFTSGSGGGTWGSITGTLSDQTDLYSYLSFNIPTTIEYTTIIPFTNALTIITGKLLITNDVFTIASDPVEGSGAQTWLDGDDVHSPDFTAFDYQSGTYAATSGTRNLITMEYLGAKSYISILNMTAI